MKNERRADEIPFSHSNSKRRTSLGNVSKKFYTTETRTPNIAYFIQPISLQLCSTSEQRPCKFPCGLVARIWRFHRHGPGSIPGMGTCLFLALLCSATLRRFLSNQCRHSITFTYCSTVWNDGNKANLKTLKKMQERAARTITGSNYHIRSKTIFPTLGWSPIENILKRRELLTTFKAVRSIAPEYICDMFTYCDKIYHQTRSNRRKLLVQKPNRSFMKKSFSYRRAYACNTLPNEILDIHEQLSA